jgi:hypothetical protein
MQTNIPVYLIYAYTTDELFYRYKINNNKEIHSKSYEDAGTYFISLVPECGQKIDELMNMKRSFIIIVNKKEVKELEFDLEKERSEWVEKIKQEQRMAISNIDIRKAVNNSSDSILKNYSNSKFIDKFLERDMKNFKI